MWDNHKCNWDIKKCIPYYKIKQLEDEVWLSHKSIQTSYILKKWNYYNKSDIIKLFKDLI